MRAVICDCCKKVIGENEKEYIGFNCSRYEVCSECRLKLEKIINEHDKELEKIDEIHQKLMNTTKNKLEELGLEVN